MRVFVVEADAARQLVGLVLQEIHGPDACLSYEQIQVGMKTANDLIRLYLTDPPAFEDKIARDFLGDEEVTYTSQGPEWEDEGGEQSSIHENGLVLEFVGIIDEAVHESADVLGLDILDLNDVIIGDHSGVVLLMI